MPESKDIRNLGAHSDFVSKPVPDLSPGLDGKPFTGETVSHKRSSKPEGVVGMFEPQAQSIADSLTEEKLISEPPISLIEKKPVTRKIRFKKNTYLYEVRHDSETGEIIIPRAPKAEEILFIEELLFDQELEIDPGCIEMGKRGRDVIRTVGKSQYGAFTVVLYPGMDEEGKPVMVQRLASLTERRLKKDNEIIRFKKATS